MVDYWLCYNGNFDHRADDCAIRIHQSFWNGGSIAFEIDCVKLEVDYVTFDVDSTSDKLKWTRYGMVWYGTVGMVWYSMGWYGMRW